MLGFAAVAKPGKDRPMWQILAVRPSNYLIFQKLMTVLFLSAGTGSMAVFVAELEYWLPRNMAVVWVTVIVGVMCLCGEGCHL